MARAGTVEVVLSGDMAGLEAALRRSEKSMEATAARLRSVGTTLSLTVTATLATLGGAALASSISFEQSVAQMAKTIEASEEAIQGLADGFTELSEQIPVARNELALIGAEAGQLGIAVEQIPSFTRTVADLRVASNLGQEAGTTLARMANIMGDAAPEFDRMGATIVHLGNNAAATEAEIAHMALRIAGAGKVIGLHHPEVLALSTGLASVGIQAEAGGTAISRVMVEIANAVASGGDKLGRFAQIAGMTAEEFQTAFQENAAEAVVDFIEGLARLNEAGENVFAVLEDVEFQNVRIRDTLLRAAGAGDLMRRSLDLAGDAWRENTALVNEAERFYDTTQGQLVILRNRINNVAGELGDVLVPALLKALDAGEPVITMVRTLIRAFSELPEGIQTIVIATGALAAVVGPAMVLLSGLASGLGAMSGMAAGAAVGLIQLRNLLSVSGLIFSIRSFADATTTARWALTGLGSVLTPGGAVLVGLGLLAAFWMRARIEAQRAAEVQQDAINKLIGSFANLDKASTLHKLGGARKAVARNEELLAAMKRQADEAADIRWVGGQHTGSFQKIWRKEDAEAVKAQEENVQRLRAAVGALEDQYVQLARAVPPEVEPPKVKGYDPNSPEERAKRIARVHSELATALQTATGMEQLLGESYDGNRARANAYRSAIQALLDEGIAPTDAQLQGYVTSLLSTEAAIKAVTEAEREALEVERERDRLRADALAIVQQAFTAEERHAQAVDRLTSAFEDGLISQEDYARGIDHLDEQLQDATKTFATTLQQQGYYAGEALIRGLLSGANNTSAILKNALVNLAVTKIMGPVKLALGIKSPSTVFRGYGEAIGEGLALGIESSAARIGRASEMMAAAVRVPNLTPAYSLAAPTPGAAAMAGAGRVEIDASKLPRPMTPFEAMRDAQWQALLRGSVDVARSQGWR